MKTNIKSTKIQIRVFNADDHPMLRKGVTDLLMESTDIKWVGSAKDGKESLEKIRVLQPDVAILDIEMPHCSGLEVAKVLLAENTKTKFVLLTLFKDETFFRNAINAGITGYLLKESTEKEILDCIRSVYEGKSYVNPNLTHYLLRDKKENSLFNNLSEHEINILKLIAKQKTTIEIGSMLFISPKTVSNHRTNISKKLNLGGEQNGLMKWAIANQEILFNFSE
ncbi:MAG: DNA-binding NarL/FixJ family response regulator [Saprospiraceae bacterium]|jgi:DNA-binding NarL/FixJ family response regulator